MTGMTNAQMGVMVAALVAALVFVLLTVGHVV